MRMLQSVSVDTGRVKCGLLFFAVCICSLILIASLIALPNSFAATPNASPSEAHTPSGAPPTSVPTATRQTVTKIPITQEPISRNSVLSFLNEAISWYRHLDVEQTLATQPAEMLYFADDREMAQKALGLAFDFARAEVAQLQATTAPLTETAAQIGVKTTTVNGVPATVVSTLSSKLAQRQAEVKATQDKITNLKSRLRRAPAASRQMLMHQIAAAQSQLKLAELRLESLQAVTNFEKGTGAGGHASGVGLADEIDQLERSVSVTSTPAKAPNPSPSQVTVPPQTEPITASGIIGHAEILLSIARKQQTLNSTIDLTNSLNASIKKLREQLITALRQIDTQANTLAAQLNTSDASAIEQIKVQLDLLTTLYKVNVNALMPLTRMSGVLQMYSANLERWREMVNAQAATNLRALAVGLGGLAIIFGFVAFGAALWRRLLFRYVQDRQRRQQLLQVRRVAVTVIVALVLVFDFANQFGALATILGFAAAGVALALQNVIMSMAGYLYVSGRYGIRVGDRVQISGINGDVLEIGLFKLTMLELSGEANGQQPTGRVVIFPNSVVFQTTGNFFRQVPGANFTWNEFKISLAPDCDYRLVEQRLLEIVGQVYSRYRESVQREYQNMERNLSIRAEAPKPMCRLQFSETVIELIVRYPVRIESTAETQDEVARRVVDKLSKEPSLRLKVQGTPNVERIVPPQAQAEIAAPPDGGPG
jgi:small-conductance mechanosensitive channel